MEDTIFSDLEGGPHRTRVTTRCFTHTAFTSSTSLQIFFHPSLPMGLKVGFITSKNEGSLNQNKTMLVIGKWC